MTITAIPISPERPAAGAIRQTLAIFHDAYRELNARKMFWVALALSILAMGIFAIVSVTPNSLKVLTYQLDTGFLPPKSLYKQLFGQLMIGLWLTWAATILALVSTASIFPDFLTSGSIDLFLSKPISRLRLFLTKYVAGMLFVFLQVAAFAVVAFFVVGVRGGIWEPRLFWMIPIVLCFFSYLFAISVFFGVFMRSTLAALLFTILFWLMVYAIHTSEIWMQASINVIQQEISDLNDQIAALNKPAPTSGPAKPVHSFLGHLQTPMEMLGLTGISDQQRRLLAQRDQEQSNLNSLQFWHSLVFPVQVIVPKTSETIALLNDMLLSRDEFETMMDTRRESAMENHRARRVEHLDVNDEIDQITRSRTLWWSIGSSLCFEAIVILLAGWLFCRRDY